MSNVASVINSRRHKKANSPFNFDEEDIEPEIKTLDEVFEEE